MNIKSDFPLPKDSGQIIRSSRRRTYSIQLHPDRSWKLLVPAAATDEQIGNALQKFTPWLQKKLARLAVENPVHQFSFTPGSTFFYLGEAVTVQYRPNMQSQIITCCNGELITPSDDPEKIKLMLENFYRRHTRQLITAKLAEYTAKYHIAIGKIAINGARRRFGSCSSRGDLNFSWLLAMYPKELIELVVLHELAHRSEMNHSPVFYRVLAGYLPDHRERNQRLNKWSKKLAAYPL